MEFDKIVKKLRKKGQKLISINDIESFIAEQKAGSKKHKSYKMIHRLVSTGVLVSIRKGMYLLNTGEKLNPEDFYWQIVKKIIAENYLGQGIISGEKALGCTLRDYSLPEVLHVIVPKNTATISLIGDYVFQAESVNGSKKSIFPLIKKHATRMTIEGLDLLIACPEHALLESLTMRTRTERGGSGIVGRWLRKNASTLREDVFAEITPYRYISALNRLKYLAYDLKMIELYQMTIRLIDRQGKGCHLSRDFLLGKKMFR